MSPRVKKPGYNVDILGVDGMQERVLHLYTLYVQNAVHDVLQM